MAKITINTGWFDAIEDAAAEVKMQVYYAVVVYMTNGSVVEMDQASMIAFSMIRKEIDKAVSISEKRRMAGRKGGDNLQNLLRQNNTNENFAKAKGSFAKTKIDFAKANTEFAKAKEDFAQANDIDPWEVKKEEVSSLSPTPSIITQEEKKETNKEKSPKGDKEKEKRKYADEVRLTEAEYNKLVERFGLSGTLWMIEKLNAFKVSKGKTYKSDYGAILNWVVERYEDYKRKQTTQQPKSGMDIYLEAAEKLARGEW